MVRTIRKSQSTPFWTKRFLACILLLLAVGVVVLFWVGNSAAPLPKEKHSRVELPRLPIAKAQPSHTLSDLVAQATRSAAAAKQAAKNKNWDGALSILALTELLLESELQLPHSATEITELKLLLGEQLFLETTTLAEQAEGLFRQHLRDPEQERLSTRLRALQLVKRARAAADRMAQLGKPLSVEQSGTLHRLYERIDAMASRERELIEQAVKSLSVAQESADKKDWKRAIDGLKSMVRLLEGALSHRNSETDELQLQLALKKHYSMLVEIFAASLSAARDARNKGDWEKRIAELESNIAEIDTALLKQIPPEALNQFKKLRQDHYVLVVDIFQMQCGQVFDNHPFKPEEDRQKALSLGIPLWQRAIAAAQKMDPPDPRLVLLLKSNLGVLYLHFPADDKKYLQGYRSQAEEIAAVLEKDPDNLDAAQLLQDFDRINLYIAVLEENRNKAEKIFQEVLDAIQKNPDLDPDGALAAKMRHDLKSTQEAGQ